MTAATRRRSTPDGKTLLLAKEHFQTLLDLLWSEGYRVIGPTIRRKPSSTTRCASSTICRAAGPTNRAAEPIG